MNMFRVPFEDKRTNSRKANQSTIISIILVLSLDLGYLRYYRVAVHYMDAHDIETTPLQTHSKPTRFGVWVWKFQGQQCELWTKV